MQNVQITEVVYTSSVVNSELFNSNFLPNANTGETPWGGNSGNELGSPTNESETALNTFNVDYVRYPAGQDKELFAEHGILSGGDIPDFVREFLTYAQSEGIQVSMVVPVETLEQVGGPSEAQIHQDLVEFARIIERDFPDVVQHYELGNEYWGKRDTNDNSRETEYGAAAAKAALALTQGTEAAGGESKVVLQASSFLGGAYGGNITAANAAIQAGWDSVTTDKSMIDGMLRNFYWRDPGVNEFHNTDGIFAEDRGITESFGGQTGTQWDDWVGHDVQRLVGEYNVQNSVARNIDYISDIGVHGASMFLEHYTNMIGADVDLAFVWPVLHNTKNALIHVHQDIEFAEVHGMDIVVNSTRAALFDVLRQTVSDYELVEFEWNAPFEVELTGFEGSGDDGISERVMFFSSRSSSVETFQVDLSQFIGDFTTVEGISLFYTQDGDNNHRNALVTEFDVSQIAQNGNFTIQLQPYEVVQLIFDVPSATIISQGSDSITGTSNADTFDGLAGDDTISGMDGSDILSGNDGDDIINGGNGNDTIAGNNGNDSILGGNGADRIFSHNGDDTIYGEFGHDIINAGGNSDYVDGGGGDDSLIGGWGHDTLIGEYGDDTLNGGSGEDVLTGGFGRDTFTFDSFDGSIDRITDFSQPFDYLDFNFSNPNGPNGFTIKAYDGGSSSIIRFTDNGVVNESYGGVILEGLDDKDYFIRKSVDTVEFGIEVSEFVGNNAAPPASALVSTPLQPSPAPGGEGVGTSTRLVQDLGDMQPIDGASRSPNDAAERDGARDAAPTIPASALVSDAAAAGFRDADVWADKTPGSDFVFADETSHFVNDFGELISRPGGSGGGGSVLVDTGSTGHVDTPNHVVSDFDFY